MILGVDHLAYSVTDTEKAKSRLETKGFVCKFIESQVENNIAKKTLLTHYQIVHDLGVFSPVFSPGELGVAIEITNHGKESTDEMSPFEYSRSCLTLNCRDPQSEGDFISTSLGFKQEKTNVYLLKAPIPNWSCQLKIVHDPKQSDYFLDSAGYPCLALLTNNLAADLSLALSNGGRDSTGSFFSMVNGKKLEVVLFRSPNGIIYELIEVSRDS